MNRRAERLVLGAVCVACLAVPAIALLAGALDEPEAADGGGRVVYTSQPEGALSVRAVRIKGRLPVRVHNAGQGVIEKDANVIPTEQVDSRTHHDASPIELRELPRGRRPAIEPAE
jgi:hypothetical protein